jgi:hypothetical protein
MTDKALLHAMLVIKTEILEKGPALGGLRLQVEPEFLDGATEQMRRKWFSHCVHV